MTDVGKTICNTDILTRFGFIYVYNRRAIAILVFCLFVCLFICQ